jgi:peroxiredoxin
VVAGLLVFGLVGAARDAFDRERGEPLRLLRPQLITREPAPDFELRDRAGQAHRLSDHQGQPVVLNFWSIGCPPCIEELPSLIHLARIARERGTFSVLTVCAEGEWEEVRELFPPETEMTVLFDPDRTVVEGRFGTRMFPETFLIDSSGRIRARFDGQRNWASPVVLDLLATL